MQLIEFDSPEKSPTRWIELNKLIVWSTLAFNANKFTYMVQPKHAWNSITSKFMHDIHKCMFWLDNNTRCYRCGFHFNNGTNWISVLKGKHTQKSIRPVRFFPHRIHLWLLCPKVSGKQCIAFNYSTLFSASLSHWWKWTEPHRIGINLICWEHSIL